jgi:CRISPR-associated protein Cmx8
MTVKEKKAKKPKPSKPPSVSVLRLDYNLVELPTSQHRAGLAGLVLMAQWLKDQKKIEGVCELTSLDDQGATLQIDELGLKNLLAETYDFREGEWESEKERTRNKSKEVIPPKRMITREIIDKNGEKQVIPIYIYRTYTPKGAFLVSYDSTADNSGKGIWVDLWRDFVWKVIRKKDTTREIYRDKSSAAKEAAATWEGLTSEMTSTKSKSSDLSGTDLLGVRAYNAEGVSFRDKARQKLLLNFWAFTSQVYIPQTTTIKQPKPTQVGYAVAIPEVARLETFCRVLPNAIRNNRGTELKGFRPRESVIDVPAEGALDFFLKLSDRVSLSEGARGTSRTVSAIDVIHVDPSGNDVSIIGTARIEPESFNGDEYERVRHNLWNHEFRKQRLLNILNGNNSKWYEGFDKLLSRLPFKLGFNAEHFSHDARESFNGEVRDLKKEKKMEDTQDTPFVDQDEDKISSAVQTGNEPKSVEALVYQAVGRYLDRKLMAKRKFGYSDVMTGAADKDEYSKGRRTLAVDAFYSVKSRTETDFVDYFANTLCSVSQNPMSEADYITLAEALLHKTDDVRTLTMLALSARS